MGNIYIHKKTGNLYKKIGTAIDSTNATEGRMMVIYKRFDMKSLVYAREITEFSKKFQSFWEFSYIFST